MAILLAPRSRIDHLLGQKLLQLGILVLLSRLASETSMPPFLPAVERRLGYPVLTGQVGRLRTSLVLLQHRNDLLFREPLSLHPSVLRKGGLQLVLENSSGAGHMYRQPFGSMRRWRPFPRINSDKSA